MGSSWAPRPPPTESRTQWGARGGVLTPGPLIPAPWAFWVPDALAWTSCFSTCTAWMTSKISLYQLCAVSRPWITWNCNLPVHKPVSHTGLRTARIHPGTSSGARVLGMYLLRWLRARMDCRCERKHCVWNRTLGEWPQKTNRTTPSTYSIVHEIHSHSWPPLQRLSNSIM